MMFHSHSSFDRKFSLSLSLSLYHHLRMCKVKSEVWHACLVAHLFLVKATTCCLDESALVDFSLKGRA